MSNSELPPKLHRLWSAARAGAVEVYMYWSCGSVSRRLIKTFHQPLGSQVWTELFPVFITLAHKEPRRCSDYSANRWPPAYPLSPTGSVTERSIGFYYYSLVGQSIVNFQIPEHPHLRPVSTVTSTVSFNIVKHNKHTRSSSDSLFQWRNALILTANSQNYTGTYEWK